MSRLFDSYIVIDWSARNAPATGRDSIWLAVLDPGGSPRLVNPSTRASAVRELDRLLAERAGQQVLVGIDVALGYPSGTARALGFDGPAWWATWSAIASRASDDDRNRNNRFEVAVDLNARAEQIGGGPFWGCPPRLAGPHLQPTKPRRRAGLSEFRLTEQRLRAEGWSPKSPWQLLGAGSVGGQSLTAIPMLADLVKHHSDPVAVWPFTSGAVVPHDRSTVVAEVWPSRFDGAATDHTVRDAAQVDTTARALRSADIDGTLASWFRPDLDDDERRAVESEEGWVLGPAAARPIR